MNVQCNHRATSSHSTAYHFSEHFTDEEVARGSHKLSKPMNFYHTTSSYTGETDSVVRYGMLRHRESTLLYLPPPHPTLSPSTSIIFVNIQYPQMFSCYEMKYPISPNVFIFILSLQFLASSSQFQNIPLHMTFMYYRIGYSWVIMGSPPPHG